MIKSRAITYLTIGLLSLHLIGLDVFTNLVIAILVAVSFIDKKIIFKLKSLLLSIKFWFLTLPFLLFAISLLYTTNIYDGWKLLELRSSLFLFPIIFGLTTLTKNQKELILKFFILLVTLSSLVGFVFNISNYLNTNDSGYFYNDNLVLIFGKQAAYFGMYINFALIGLFYFWQKNLLKNKTERIISIIVLILLLIAQYLLASRTAMAISFIALISFIIVIGVTKIGKKKGVVLLLSFGILFTSLIIVFPKVLKRFESLKQIEYKFDNPNQINHFNGEISKENWNGLNTRLAIWNCAWDEIKKAPIIGTGLGSQQESLISNYESKSFNFAIKSNYNSHNQYLDVLLSNGFIGLAIFLFFVIFLIYKSIQTGNWLLLGLVIIFAISCLTENILSRNQGVIIISILLSLFFSQKNKST
jgi:O-antigen ligase